MLTRGPVTQTPVTPVRIYSFSKMMLASSINLKPDILYGKSANNEVDLLKLSY